LQIAVILLHIVGRTYDLLLFVLEKKFWDSTCADGIAVGTALPCAIWQGCADGNAVGIGAAQNFMRKISRKCYAGKI
jgi:hypothetical protein